MRVQEFFDLARVDVLAAPDDHVLEPADDLHIAFVVHHPEVACMHPAAGIDRLARRLLVVPVAQHHRVAACAKFARLAALHDLAVGRVDDLDLDVRIHAAYGSNLLVEGVAYGTLSAHRRGFGHPVHHSHFRHVHQRVHLLHDLERARRAGHDSSAERAEIELFEARAVELADKHGRRSVERSAALGLHAFHRGDRVV